MPRTLTIQEYHCKRCNHKWLPRRIYKKDQLPGKCPNCSDPYWYRPYVYSTKGKKKTRKGRVKTVKPGKPEPSKPEPEKENAA